MSFVRQYRFFLQPKQILKILRRRNNGIRIVWHPADDPLYFRVALASDDQDEITFFGIFCHISVDLLHKGTGGIYNGKACIFQVFLDLASHAVRPDDDCPRFQPMQIFILRNDPNTFFGKFLYHFFIVDDM